MHIVLSLNNRNTAQVIEVLYFELQLAKMWDFFAKKLHYVALYPKLVISIMVAILKPKVSLKFTKKITGGWNCLPEEKNAS